jgi:hypothetical protein
MVGTGGTYICKFMLYFLVLGNKPYACKLCDKSFANRGSLWVHNRRHEVGSKPYACSFCPKAGLEKTRVLKKNQPSGFFGFLGFFWVFLGFFPRRESF